MEVSISYEECKMPDDCQNHHNDDGELFVGIAIHPIEEMADMTEDLMEAINCCAQPSALPWAEIRECAIAFFEKEDIAAYQQDLSQLEEPWEESELQWWFLIAYGSEDEDDDDI